MSWPTTETLQYGVWAKQPRPQVRSTIRLREWQNCNLMLYHHCRLQGRRENRLVSRSLLILRPLVGALR